MNAPLSALPRSARVSPDLRHAFGGVWRLTYRRLFTPRFALQLAGLLAVLAILALANVRAADSRDYFQWTVGFYLMVLMPTLAFLSAGGAIRDDLKAGSVDYVLTRPVRRPAYLIFKYLSHTACTQLLALLALGVVLGVGAWRHTPGLVAALPLLLLAQFLIVCAFSAFGFLCGVLTARYLVVGLLYAGVIELGIGAIPTPLSRLSMTHQVKAMLLSLTGNSGLNRFFQLEQGPLLTTAVLLAFSIAMLSVAALVFATRELAGARTQET